MSSAAEEGTKAELAEADTCCANCGAAEVDDIKLEDCGGCDLVKYCGDRCREDHREQHEEECKDRKALLHDRKLMQQPDETHLGECPLCFLPLPLDRSKSMFRTCCSETICMGCVFANCKSNVHDPMKARRCPFCREVAYDKENEKRTMKRIKANDPAALRHMAGKCHKEGNYEGALEYWTKSAELGDVEARYNLGLMYMNGEGVEEDEEKAVYHYEKAAIGGHPFARYNLAANEEEHGNVERAVKHFIIAANLGDDQSMKCLWDHYSLGNITKEDLDATLRTHQAAIDATKSEQREEADALFLLRQNLR
jgi:hypothetical protein